MYLSGREQQPAWFDSKSFGHLSSGHVDKWSSCGAAPTVPAQEFVQGCACMQRVKQARLQGSGASCVDGVASPLSDFV